MGNDKGKAIAIDSDGKSSREGTRNHGARPDGSSGSRVTEINLGSPGVGANNIAARPNGSIIPEIYLGAPPPNSSNIIGVETSDQWVMRGTTFMREINLPPLARRSIYDSRMNPNFRWVRVYVPLALPPPNLNFLGEDTSPQGAAMFNGSTHSGMHLFAPPPIFDIHGRPIYHPSAPRVVFNSYPTIRVIHSHAPPPNFNNFGEGTSAQGAAWQGGDQSGCVRFVSSLNPNAQEWCEVPQEARTLFVTFSYGYPLTIKQVFWFLAASFGIWNLVEVDIHQPREGPAHFGRLVFKAVTIPMIILNGREEAQIIVYGKSMICKKWRPKKDRRRQHRH